MNEKNRKDRYKVNGIAGVESGQDVGFKGRIAPHGYAGPDLDKYRHHVAHFDLTEAQKTELLLTVWRIMQSFVDRAFGDDPVQQAPRERERDSLKGPFRPVIDLQPVSESRDDDEDLSGAFSRHAVDADER